MRFERNLESVNDLRFRSITESSLDFDTVVKRIEKFMKEDPYGKYRLMVGTDSQVHKRHTTFISGIVIQRTGDVSWGCIKALKIPRKFTNLHEKISFETSLTEEIAYKFTPEIKERLIDIILPHIYQGAAFKIQGHIDIGEDEENLTKLFVREMTARIEAVGMEPVIKPDAIVASSYANRYTK